MTHVEAVIDADIVVLAVPWDAVDFGKVRHAHIIEWLYSAAWNMRNQGYPVRVTFEAAPPPR